jgi:low affinity Fe/Cu permease
MLLIPMAEHTIGRFLTSLGVWTSTPWAFGVFLLYGISWAAFDQATLNWHEVATLATWLMTLCIQRAEHRDTQAIHAKLDELLRTQNDARDELTQLDKKEPESIERHREAMRERDEGQRQEQPR